VWQIPDAVDTVVCAPDDGWSYHPKHIEQCSDINKLCNVASCWIYSEKKQYLYRSGQTLWSLGGWGSQKLWIFGTWRWYGWQPYSPAAFAAKEIPLLPISFRGYVDPKAIYVNKNSRSTFGESKIFRISIFRNAPPEGGHMSGRNM
jgi:hypothetical protein